MRPTIQGVYSITHTASGRKYIGSSRDVLGRWKFHRNRLAVGTHENEYLQRAYNKYGRDTFEWHIEEFVERHEDLLDREQFFMESLKSTNRRTGFNIRPQANGYALSEETKRKIAAKAKGRKNPSVRKRFSNKLTVEDTIAIRRRLAAWDTLQSIADDFGIGMTMVIHIARRQSGWDVQLDPETEAKIDARPRHPKQRRYISERYRVTEDLAREIKKRFRNWDSVSDIAAEFGLKYATVYAIRCGATWSHID